VLGSALVLHPALGHAVRPSNAVASTDFLTALYVGGASISVVGSSGYRRGARLERYVELRGRCTTAPRARRAP
jgi:hypothetical protein